MYKIYVLSEFILKILIYLHFYILIYSLCIVFLYEGSQYHHDLQWE